MRGGIKCVFPIIRSQEFMKRNMFPPPSPDTYRDKPRHIPQNIPSQRPCRPEPGTTKHILKHTPIQPLVFGFVLAGNIHTICFVLSLSLSIYIYRYIYICIHRDTYGFWVYIGPKRTRPWKLLIGGFRVWLGWGF